VDPAPSSPYGDRSTVFKIMEYMSLGKPIVAFDLPEHRFTAQQAAVYVPPNDERAFARSMAELVDDPQRRVALGVIGRHRVQTQLAWEYSIPNLLHAYGLVLPLAAHSRRRVSPDAMTAVQPQTSSFGQTRDYKSGDRG
jgi:glycosyltransferase involved in cell wall biosynthesis